MNDQKKIIELMSDITIKLQNILDKTDELSEDILGIREATLDSLIDLSACSDYSELSPEEQELYDEYEHMIKKKLTRKKK
eukprot:SAG11_NODE_3989_length_2119_cov_90.913366_4_plen_80_part_00